LTSSFGACPFDASAEGAAVAAVPEAGGVDASFPPPPSAEATAGAEGGAATESFDPDGAGVLAADVLVVLVVAGAVVSGAVVLGAGVSGAGVTDVGALSPGVRA
jgi:hypothetical protein